MLKSLILVAGLLSTIAAAAQQQTSESGRYTKDPAPTGYEDSERLQGRKSSVTITGKDAPVTETREGNKIKLDFDSKNQPGREQNTTIIRDRKK